MSPAIEGISWVKRELKRRSRSIEISVTDDKATVVGKSKGKRIVVEFVEQKVKRGEKAAPGCWRATFHDTQRATGLQSWAIDLPRIREDRHRVLFAIAKEYLYPS